jgi:hypothetical protein
MKKEGRALQAEETEHCTLLAWESDAQIAMVKSRRLWFLVSMGNSVKDAATGILRTFIE